MNNNTRQYKTLGVVLGIVLVVLLGWGVYRSLAFHVVRTDPKLSAVAQVLPSIDVYFNRPLDSTSVTLSDPQKVIGKTTVRDKVLTLNFSHTLDIKSYKLSLSVNSTGGDSLSDVNLDFTVKNIAVQGLSPVLQKKIQSHQSQFQYSLATIDFIGFDTLLDNGLSSDQLSAVKQAVYDFSIEQKTEFTNVTVNEKTIVPGAFDPNGNDQTRTLNFNMTANGKSYRAVISYEDLTHAATIIYDSKGKQVYNFNNNDAGYDE